MIIDADSHWAPPAEIFKDCLPDTLFEKYQTDNKSYLETVDTRKQNLVNDIRVDRQLLNFYGPTVGLSYRSGHGLATQLSTRYNQSMHNLCKHNSEFDYTSWLPLQDLSASIRLLDSDSVEQSFAIHAGEQVPWGFMPRYKEFFELIGKRKIPFYLHFAGHYDFPLAWNADIDSNYQLYYNRYPTVENAGVGESNTWKINLASLILSGMLEQYNLKIIVAEQGLSWIPEFQDAMWNISRVDPMPYFQRFFWFTTEPEEQNFLTSATALGYDRLLFATDWPHGNSDIGGSNQLLDVLLLNEYLTQNKITDSDYQLITHKNYLNLKNRI